MKAIKTTAIVRTAALALLISATGISSTWAEDKTAPVQDAGARPSALTLSLARARELTLAKSAALRKAELAVNAASLTKRAQDYAALPTVTATASGSTIYGSTSSSSNGLSAAAEVSASATVFDGGKNAALSREYDLATEAARQSLRSERIALIGNADAAFFAVLEDEASAEAAAGDLEAAQISLKIAEAKVEAGALSKVDYLETASQTASYQATLSRAQKTLSSARAQLASLTGLPAFTEPEQIDFASYDGLLSKIAGLDDARLDKLVSDLVAMARTNSPSLSSYALSASQARMNLAAAKSAYLPTIAASAAQSFADKSAGLYPSGSITMSASLSLDFWLTKNAVEQAEVAMREEELNAGDQTVALDLEVSQAVYNWISSALVIPSSAKALEYAQSNYENVLEKFKLSSVTASDLTTAAALVSTDKEALISARYTFLTNLSTLRDLVGLEDEAKLLEVL